MALEHSLGAGIPVHPRWAWARCISSKPVENYKHTQGHSGAEPASHRAHLIQSEMQQLPPSVCLHVWLQLFHYLFEQIGLRLVCSGLIVTRRWEAPESRMLWPGFCWAPLLTSRPAFSFSFTFPEQWSAVVLTSSIFALLRPLLWLIGKRGGCFANATAGEIYVYGSIKAPICHTLWGAALTHLTAQSHPEWWESLKLVIKQGKKMVNMLVLIS